MFEAEVEMERRSSILPLLLMLCLVTGILGVAGYIVSQVRGKTALTAQQATPIVTTMLAGHGPAVIHFRTGLVKASADEQPSDVNYRLLEKAGVVKVAKQAGDKYQISITPKGEEFLAAIADSKKTKQGDSTTIYEVPLAGRQLVGIVNIQMNNVNSATVQYSWKWLPNSFGDLFDASGPLVKSFNLWERQTLINKYQVDFYRGEPTKSALMLARVGKEWRIAQ